MSACEKCWADAGGVYARYLELLEERKDNPCPPPQKSFYACAPCRWSGFDPDYYGNPRCPRCAQPVDVVAP